MNAIFAISLSLSLYLSCNCHLLPNVCGIVVKYVHTHTSMYENVLFEWVSNAKLTHNIFCSRVRLVIYFFISIDYVTACQYFSSAQQCNQQRTCQFLPIESDSSWRENKIETNLFTSDTIQTAFFRCWQLKPNRYTNTKLWCKCVRPKEKKTKRTQMNWINEAEKKATESVCVCARNIKPESHLKSTTSSLIYIVRFKMNGIRFNVSEFNCVESGTVTRFLDRSDILMAIQWLFFPTTFNCRFQLSKLLNGPCGQVICLRINWYFVPHKERRTIASGHCK